MKVTVEGRLYELAANVREDGARRRGFFALAKNTFGLDFEPWYQNGWWTDAYRPYVLFDGEKAAANVSVNLMDFRLYGQRKRCVQLGTVMTAPEYRGKGLSRFLMDRVLREWKDACGLVYLYANDSVLDFYPKFGFQRVRETAYEAELRTVKRNSITAGRLNMDKPEDRNCLLSHYARSNPFSACSMEGNPGLLMFYCGGFLKDSLWYVKEADAVIIAGREETGPLCWDVFGGQGFSLPELLAALAGPEAGPVRLGFQPKPAAGVRAVGIRREEDETMFAMGRELSLFSNSPLLLPLLSHA